MGDEFNTSDPNTFLGAHFSEDAETAQKFIDELYGADQGNNPKMYGVWLRLERPLGGDAQGSVSETKEKISGVPAEFQKTPKSGGLL